LISQTHGISHVTNDAESPYQSNTALPITTSCSFNTSLWTATGNQIGREARAFMNIGHAYCEFIVMPSISGHDGLCASQAMMVSVLFISFILI
jgi:hypothetical protein